MELGIKCKDKHHLPFFAAKDLEVVRINFMDKCIFNDLNDTIEDIINRRYKYQLKDNKEDHHEHNFCHDFYHQITSSEHKVPYYKVYH